MGNCQENYVVGTSVQCSITQANCSVPLQVDTLCYCTTVLQVSLLTFKIKIFSFIKAVIQLRYFQSINHEAYID